MVFKYSYSFYGDVYDFNRYPDPESVNFKFKKECQSRGGVIHLNDGMNPESPFSGVLLACEKRGEFGTPVVVEKSEINDIIKKIKNKDPEYSPKDERERLLLYFSIVYPSAFEGFENNCCFKKMTTFQLEEYYKDLEFYYKLPSEIMPQTKVTIHRPENKRFYRVPVGVILDQDPQRTGIVGRYIEVTRFGTMHSLLRNPTLFNGTYYYPAKGSGLFLPLGRSLIAYNKVHALKLLDASNEDILKVSGRDFQYFLRKDSETLWKQIKKQNPNASKEHTFTKTCVVDKTATVSRGTCKPFMEVNTKIIEYIPEALDRIIKEMVSGKCLREDYRSQSYILNYKGRDDRDGDYDDNNDKSPKQKVLIYYGLGDTGDKFLAQIARDRSYSTLQFLREAQMSLKGDAVVGNELLHLVEPTYSQTFLARLNPCLNPYQPIFTDVPHVNYLLDSKISPVAVQMISEGNFDPWENKEFKLNVVVPYRK